MSKVDLLRLQAQGKYVFHGSIYGSIAALKPSQAYSHGKPDGQPCIAAAERIEPAIFMAILGGRHVGGWGKGVIRRGQFGFFAAESDYMRAKQEQWTGYVYILRKADFRHYSAWEWRASKPVKPSQIVKVSFSDLPEDIALE